MREAEPLESQTGWLSVGRHGRLLWQRWGQTAGRLVIVVHGGGEHSGRYAATGAWLAACGYVLAAVDLPGHGRSPGVRGHIRRLEDYVDVVQAFVRHMSRDRGDRPPVVLGHSLGGLIATVYAVRYPETLAGLVLSSPLWGLRLPVPLWKRVAGRVLSPLWPSLTLARPAANGPVLSHDPQVELAYQRDPLVHHRASVRLYTEIQRWFGKLPGVLPHVQIPVLVLQAGEDGLASAQAVRELFPLIGSSRKRLIVYEGYYHEVLNEVGRLRVLTDLDAWVRGLEGG